MHSKVNSLYAAWADRFLEEWQDAERYTPCLTGNNLPEDELEFVRVYLGHMLIDGSSTKKIKQFLYLQSAKSDAEMLLSFIGGSPVEVFLYCYSLSDIDIADSFRITGFTEMHVSLLNGGEWTEEEAKAFVDEVREDLEYDGYTVNLMYEIQGEILLIGCETLPVLT